MGKKNNNAKMLICFSVVLLVLCALSFYLGGLYTSSFIKKAPETNTDNSAQVEEKEKTTDTSTVSYVGSYGFKRTQDDASYNEELYLRNDGTYYLALNNYYANQPSVGNYTVNSDNTITLKETVHYGSDACYFTSNLRTFILNIKDENTLTLTYEGLQRTFTKGTIDAEKQSHLTYYVTNPVNGVTPSGWEDAWTDCTNKQTR